MILNSPEIINAIAVHKTSVTLPKLALNKIVIPNTIVIKPPIASTHDLRTKPEKLNNEIPFNKNHIPTIRRNMVKPAAM
jgi:hypothetical protein